MKYEVWFVRKNWTVPSGTKIFNRYQDAKKYAKELATQEDIFKVWISAREHIKGPKYF